MPPAAAAAAAAKLLQSCLTLCDPIDGSLPGSPIPGILQARTLEWVAISFSYHYLFADENIFIKLFGMIDYCLLPKIPSNLGIQSGYSLWSLPG